MLNVLIAGVGGQGSVLAAKVLASAARAKGWQVRTAETIGMAQRGGNVTSHVRMGNLGEQVHAPLLPRGSAQCIIALEPGEAVRALPYLGEDGLLVCAQTGIPSIMDSVNGTTYDVAGIVDYLRGAVPHFATIDERAVCQQVGSLKVANIALLAAAVRASELSGCGLAGAVNLNELSYAIEDCVKPQFLELNLAAVDAAAALVG